MGPLGGWGEFRAQTPLLGTRALSFGLGAANIQALQQEGAGGGGISQN